MEKINRTEKTKKSSFPLLVLCVCFILSCFTLLTACNTSAVAFKLNFVVDGEIIKTIDTGGNETISMPQNPSKEGYTFDGWYWDNGTFTRPFTANSLLDELLTADLSVYAKFKLNMKDFSGVTFESKEFTYDGTIKSLTVSGIPAGTEVSYDGNDKTEVGTYSVTATLKKDGYNNKTLTATLKINERLPDSVSLSRKNLNLTLGEEQVLLATVLPETANNKNVLWSSSNSRVVAVSNGVVSALAEGTATITATTVNGKTDECVVTVIKEEIIFKTIPIENTTGYIKVPNAQETFSFISEVQIKGKVKFYVCLDMQGASQILTKVAPLNIGDNVFYILEMKDENVLNLYTITVRRRPIWTVDFDANGGTAVQSQSIEEDAFATEPKTTRAGYTFIDWNYDFKKPITADTTVKASWSANKDTAYKVEYYLQNLENDGYTLEESIPLKGTTDTTASAEQKTYEHFTLDASMGQLNGNIEGDGSLTLRVYYARNKYAVTFDTAGGSRIGGGSLKQYVKYRGDATAPSVERSGYTFDGWDNIFTDIDKAVSVKATWKIITYGITYDLNGGANDDKNVSKYTVEDVVTLYAPEKTGYEFTGWTLDGKAVTKIEKGTIGDKTLVATWQIINYGITYNLNDGVNDEDNPSGYTIESQVITLKSPTKITNVKTTSVSKGNGNYEVTKEITEYTFMGWYTDEAFGNCIEVIESGTTGNINLYAKWSENTTTTTTEQAYMKDDNYLYFGSYPQTDVTTEKGNELSSYTASLPTAENSNGWTSYKYYISGSNSTDFMWYKDVDTDKNGVYDYRAVYFTSYRPYWTTYSSSAGNSNQDDNSYETGNVYWFKWEPIKWRILDSDGSTATILAELILDSQDYNYTSNSRTIDGKTVYGNNYEYSSIRKWLNESFYNTAFTELQKQIINIVVVDNSARSTNPDSSATYWNSGINNYACQNTQDKVWLLSQQEVTKADYGFNTSPSAYDTLRRKQTSAYAKCQGAYTYSGGFQPYGYWWLRSPYYHDDRYSWYVNDGGDSSYCGYRVYSASYGVVPALQITL